MANQDNGSHRSPSAATEKGKVVYLWLAKTGTTHAGSVKPIGLRAELGARRNQADCRRHRPMLLKSKTTGATQCFGARIALVLGSECEHTTSIISGLLGCAGLTSRQRRGALSLIVWPSEFGSRYPSITCTRLHLGSSGLIERALFCVVVGCA